jgi:hypothetical protein
MMTPVERERRANHSFHKQRRRMCGRKTLTEKSPQIQCVVAELATMIDNSGDKE